MDNSYERVRNYLLNEAREIILEKMPVASCVTSTRICIELLNEYGIFSYPLQVHAVTANPGLTIVGRNPLGNPKGWNGHLVCVVPQEEELIDISLEQIGLLPISTRFQGDFPVSTMSADFPVIYFKDGDPQPLDGVYGWDAYWKELFPDILQHKP